MILCSSQKRDVQHIGRHASYRYYEAVVALATKTCSLLQVCTGGIAKEDDNLFLFNFVFMRSQIRVAAQPASGRPEHLRPRRTPSPAIQQQNMGGVAG
jgi:hypothetical protein